MLYIAGPQGESLQIVGGIGGYHAESSSPGSLGNLYPGRGPAPLDKPWWGAVDATGGVHSQASVLVGVTFP